jgi:membrane-associated phospholipid phosphatase
VPKSGHVDRDHSGAGLVATERRHALLFGGVLGPLGVFAALAAAVGIRGGLPGDSSLPKLLAPIEDWPLPSGLHSTFDLSPVLGAMLLLAVFLWLILRGRLGEALFGFLAVAGLVAAEPLLKEIFARPPPGEGGSGWSFPSGTAMVTLGVAYWLVLLARPRGIATPAVAAAAGFVVAFGLAMVYLRWHYPTDILAGWALAFAWVSALWLASTFTRETLRGERDQTRPDEPGREQLVNAGRTERRRR